MNSNHSHASNAAVSTQPAAPAALGPTVRGLAREPFSWLLLAMPVALALEWGHAGALWIFIFSGVAVVPLAGLMGRSTESLAETLGAGLGGFLNATFGNAAELIIALMILWRGPAMYPLVKATITGSIIGNLLFVLGMAILLGGLRHRRQVFNRTAAGMGATLLTLACIGLIMPTVYYYLFRVGAALSPEDQHTMESLSEEIAAILAVVYGLSLIFSLGTHQHLFAGSELESKSDSGSDVEPALVGTPHGANHLPEWNRTTSLVVLLTATVGVAVMGHLLVGSVELAGRALGMNQVFLGVIVVAIVGNAAEHSTAVLVAMKDKMDLALNIAVGSSLQIALFVAPVLVFASMLMGHPHPLDLHFSPLELIAVVLTVGVLALVSQDGESHWMEGAMLLAVYIILGLAFYHLPVRAL